MKRHAGVGQQELVHIQVALFIGQKKTDFIGRDASSINNIHS